MNPSSMTPVDWAKRPLQKYADFTGRAPRAEFWWYFLFIIIAAIVAAVADSIVGLPKVFLLYGPVMLLLLVGTFVPSLAVQVRRLHDRNKSGLWLLGFYVPYFLMLFLSPAMRGDLTATPSLGSAAIAGVLALIVLAIAIALLIFYCMEGTPGDNRFGPNPYGETGESVVAAE
jgi:uncharacterized membrane protein YhaH (DUF805 family)